MGTRYNTNSIIFQIDIMDSKSLFLCYLNLFRITNSFIYCFHFKHINRVQVYCKNSLNKLSLDKRRFIVWWIQWNRCYANVNTWCVKAASNISLSWETSNRGFRFSVFFENLSIWYWHVPILLSDIKLQILNNITTYFTPLFISNYRG